MDRGAHLRRLLKDLTPIERDALRRFYRLQQSPDQIQTATGLTKAQLNKLKTRLRKASTEHSDP